MQWNTIQQWKGRHYRYNQQHRWISNTLCQIKKPVWNSSVLLLLYDPLEKAKSEVENKWVVKSGGEFDYRWMVSSQGLSLGNDRIVLYLDCSGGYMTIKKKALVAQLCPTLCHSLDCSSPGSSVHGILEWVAIPFSRGSSWPRDWIRVSCIAVRFFTEWATRKAHFCF